MLKVLIYGATGMVGQGVLREAVNAADVSQIVCVGRHPVEHSSSKVSSLVLVDIFNHNSIAQQLAGFDACFFCLGTTSMGKTEQQYSHITYELTKTVADLLCAQNPNMVFVYVSAQGADSTEQGNVMWARVRGKLENYLFNLGFKQAYAFRPGYIQPMDGIKSKTLAYRILYNLFGFTYPLLKKLFPGSVTSTREIGLAMLNLARGSTAPSIVDPVDINRLALDSNRLEK
jgi:uncharacterized protein YbjT (DUF2867 family)